MRQNNRVAANLIKTLYFRLHYTSNFDHTFTACRLPLAKHDRRGACRHASGAARQQKTESPRVLCPMSGQNPKMAYQIIGWRIKLSWLGPFLARPLFFLLALLARVTASSVHSRLRRRTSPWPRRCGLFCSEIKVVTRLDREVSRRVECPRPTVLDTGTEQIVVMKCSARGTSSVYEGSGPSCPGSR